MAEGKRTSIEPGLVARVVAGLKLAATGKAPDWMTPGEPVQPVTTGAQQEAITGRAFDFPVGFNQRIQPRQEEGVTFAEMRALADGYDLLRLVIESRKDQIGKLDFVVQPRDKKSSGLDAKCKAAYEFLQSPDRENGWHDWLRMLLEDMLVIDAPTIYPRLTLGGDLYALELVDGATITRKLDTTGRTPLPPEVAYQQVLKGVPAVDYTLDELIYAPRNKRTSRVYGYSPVEQVIMTVNIAIRRQLHQLQYYTEGSTPDLIFSVPETWNPDQTRMFAEYWNSLLAGNTAQRRNTMFVPGGVQTVNTKEAALKDEYDEWLARVICYAFSLSPQAFVQQMNRSTSETAMQQALEEGLYPLMKWLKGLLDRILARYFGPEIEFVWVGDKEQDPKVAAEIHAIYLDKGVLTADEVRADIGRDPLTDEQREQIAAAKPQLPALPGTGNAPQGSEESAQGDESDEAGKVFKGSKKKAY